MSGKWWVGVCAYSACEAPEILSHEPYHEVNVQGLTTTTTMMTMMMISRKMPMNIHCS